MKTLPLLTLGLLNGPKDNPRVTTDSALKSKQDYDPSKLYAPFNLSVPVDHFHNDSKYAPHALGRFPLRYWFDASHYTPGGPVILLAAGEVDAAARLPILQKGIVSILSRATNGIGVVLEHRYYGKSFPAADLSIRNLRFLDTQQALADTAYFAQNVKFPGLENLELKPDQTPWIVYGGSYAGSFAVCPPRLRAHLNNPDRRFCEFSTQTYSGAPSVLLEFRPLLSTTGNTLRRFVSSGPVSAWKQRKILSNLSMVSFWTKRRPRHSPAL
jgi:hypothetical protein